jgi:hypothetical protein
MRWIALVLALAACHGQPPSTGSDVWKPTTVEPDPDCAQCTELGAGVVAHAGDGRILVDTEVDDPVAQWNGCASSLIRCLEDADSVDDCVHASSCPEPCIQAYDDAIDGDPTFLERIDLVDAVFFTVDGICAPPDQVEVSP